MYVRTYLVSGATHDGWKDGPGGIVPGEACLTQSGAIVAHQGSALFIVAHGSARILFPFGTSFGDNHYKPRQKMFWLFI